MEWKQYATFIEEIKKVKLIVNYGVNVGGYLQNSAHRKSGLLVVS